jgi:hypothetical protein
MADCLWLQPVATIAGSAIAVTAAWLVAARQIAIAAKVSDTAALSLKEKIFERRLAAFIDVMTELRDTCTEAPNPSTIPRVKKTLWEERFLFTPKVYRQIATGYEYADQLRSALSLWANSQGRNFTEAHFQEMQDKANRARHILERHIDDLADMVMPDMALFTLEKI